MPLCHCHAPRRTNSAHSSSVATVKPADGANTRLPSLKPRDMDRCSAAPGRYTAPYASARVATDPGESRRDRREPRLRAVASVARWRRRFAQDGARPDHSQHRVAGDVYAVHAGLVLASDLVLLPAVRRRHVSIDIRLASLILPAGRLILSIHSA